MGYTLSSQYGKEAYNTMHYVVDTEAEINTLPTDVTPGSTAFIIENSKTYMLNNAGKWIEVIIYGGGDNIIYDGGEENSSGDDLIYDGGTEV